MTGPILNPPRSYDTITELCSSTGEPLPVPVLLEPDACESCGAPATSLPFQSTTLCATCTDQIISDLVDDIWPNWPYDQEEVLP